MYKSSDGGTTWHATGGGAAAVVNKDGWSGGLAFDGQDPTTVYASIGRTLVKSADAGASWQPIADGLPDQVISALAVDPRRSGTAYAGLHGGGIYKTTDGGRTWNNVVPGLSIAALAIDPKRPTTIYAAGNDRAGAHPNRVRLLRSTDDGNTWSIAG